MAGEQSLQKWTLAAAADLATATSLHIQKLQGRCFAVCANQNMRAVGLDTLGSSSVDFVVKGCFEVALTPLHCWMAWCSKVSGMAEDQITLPKALAAFKAGRFKHGDSTYQELFWFRASAGDVYLIPQAWLAARKQTTAAGFRVRRLCHMHGEADIKNLSLAAKLLAASDSMGSKLMNEVFSVAVQQLKQPRIEAWEAGTFN